MGLLDFLFNSKQNGKKLKAEIDLKLADNNPEIKQVQQPLLSQDEIDKLIQQIARGEFTNKYEAIGRDPLFEDAAKLIVSSQMGSTSLIQRRMKLGSNRSELLMNQLELAGIVGPNQGTKVREVKIKTDSDLENISTSAIANVDLLTFIELYKERIDKAIIEYKNELKAEQLQQEKDKMRQLLLEKDRKKQLSRTVLKELIQEESISNQFIDEKGKREPIPQEIMDQVWNRDGGKCVKCGSQQRLEFDHIIPFSKGGATTYRNLQILCKSCNIDKSNSIG